MDDSDDSSVPKRPKMDNKQGSWTRSNNLNKDYQQVFQSGELFDCSFKVGAAPNCQVFKCHKVILSIASEVFQTMLYGHFKEATMSPDDPIIIEDTDPETFSTAMGFIYERAMSFKDIPHAMKVHRFAHKMQIVSLLTAVETYLGEQCNHSNVLVILEAFNLSGNQGPGSKKCSRVLYEQSHRVILSANWLEASAETVEVVLKLQHYRVKQHDLFRALLRWGTAQLAKDGEDESKLRAKVEPFLKFIYFESMLPIHAAEVCRMSNIFSVEEKYSLLLATVLEDSKCLPQVLAVEHVRQESNALSDWP